MSAAIAVGRALSLGAAVLAVSGCAMYQYGHFGVPGATCCGRYAGGGFGIGAGPGFGRALGPPGWSYPYRYGYAGPGLGYGYGGPYLGYPYYGFGRDANGVSKYNNRQRWQAYQWLQSRNPNGSGALSWPHPSTLSHGQLKWLRKHR